MTELTSEFIQQFNPKPRKGQLKSYLVFGVNGELGNRCAQEISENMPAGTTLRLSTSNPDNIPAVQDKFPEAEIVTSSYFDLDSLIKAFEGIEGAMIISTDFIEEDVAVNNIISAIKHHDHIKHLVRILGDPPGMRIKDVPQKLIDLGPRKAGAAYAHPLAREILTKAELPITFVNMASYLMKNFINPKFRKSAIENGFLMFPYDHATPLIDSREVGEIAGKILLSNDHRHIGVTYDLDNGNDMLTVREQSEIISEEYGIDLKFISDDNMDAYIEASNNHPTKRYGLGLMEYSAFEWELQNRFYLSDTMERLLGRKPKTFREWLREHRDLFDLSYYGK